MQLLGWVSWARREAFRKEVDRLVGEESPIIDDHYRSLKRRKALELLQRYGPASAALPRPGYEVDLKVTGFNSVRLVNRGGQLELHVW